jgi:hypothetical protein
VLQREGLLCRKGVAVVVIKRRRERERERERDFIKNIGNGAKEFVIV